MTFFTSGFFWLVEGILLCLVLVGFKSWMEDRAIPMPVWKWALVLAWIVLVGSTLAFIGTSLGENEIKAAVRGGLLFGFITAAAGVGLWRMLKKGAG
jgi:hypothetical protein